VQNKHRAALKAARYMKEDAVRI